MNIIMPPRKRTIKRLLSQLLQNRDLKGWLNPKLTHSCLWRYGVAVFTVAIALCIRWLLTPLFGTTSPFLLFMLAVVVSAWYGGLKPGLLATLLSGLLGHYVFNNHLDSLSVSTPANIVRLGLFLLVGVQISWLTEQLHQAKRKSEAIARKANLHLASLRESEELNKLLIDGVKDYGIYMLDTEGYIVSWNAGAERNRGYKAEEIIGQHFSRFYIDEDIALGKPEQALKIAASEGRFELEGWRLRKDGSQFWANVVITALRDDAGNLRGFANIARDITERKQADSERTQLLLGEQAARAIAEAANDMVQRLQVVTDVAIAHHSLDDLLSELLERLSQVLNVDTSAILLMDAQSNNLVVRAAKGLEEQARCQVRIPIGQGFGGRIAAERQMLVIEQDAYTQVYSPILREPEIQSIMGVPLLLEDRVLGVVQVGTLNPRQFTPDDRHLLQLVGDRIALAIDRANLYEAEQKARTQAEAANRLKDEFLAIVSHELRTPLNSILGWAQMLRTRKMNEDVTARALETIERNAKQQVKLIDDILDISRIIRGKIHLTTVPLNLVPIVEAAIEAVTPAAQAKGIEIRHKCDRPLLSVLGDRDRLQQILWNLLSNAVKFTPNGGCVEVRLSVMMESPMTQSMPYAQITVTDTGIGITPDFLPHVFEGFRQADGSMTRHHGGLGLGLTIVHYLVELHGGTVQAFSEGEGKGTTLTVQLPLLEASRKDEGDKRKTSHAPSLMPNAQFPIPLKGLSVLVVDDDLDTRDLIATALAEYGVHVTAVSSASEALDVMKQSMPDILVSDISMPGENGYQLIRKVRQMETRNREPIPAIALTAYAREEDRQMAIKAGFQMHVSKPVEPANLATAIAAIAAQT